jgi:hypothetical protein
MACGSARGSKARVPLDDADAAAAAAAASAVHASGAASAKAPASTRRLTKAPHDALRTAADAAYAARASKGDAGWTRLEVLSLASAVRAAVPTRAVPSPARVDGHKLATRGRRAQGGTHMCAADEAAARCLQCRRYKCGACAAAGSVNAAGMKQLDLKELRIRRRAQEGEQRRKQQPQADAGAGGSEQVPPPEVSLDKRLELLKDTAIGARVVWRIVCVAAACGARRRRD